MNRILQEMRDTAFRKPLEGWTLHTEEDEVEAPKGFETALADFVQAIQVKLNKHYTKTLNNVRAPVLSIDPKGRKYVRIVSTGSGSQSVYCFVDKSNGDILMSAGWKTPAKGARGNIYAADPTKGTGPYGAEYKIGGGKYAWDESVDLVTRWFVEGEGEGELVEGPKNPTIRDYLTVLVSNLTQYDKAQGSREAKKGGRGNIYRLGHLLKAAHEVEAKVQDILDDTSPEARKKLEKVLAQHFIVTSKGEHDLPPLRNLVKQLQAGTANIKISKEVKAAGKAESIAESMSRYCEFWKASNGKWYLDLASNEYGEYEDATTYGPFSSEDAAEKYLDNFSNPGSSNTDDSGERPPPTKSPDGGKVVSPRKQQWGSREAPEGVIAEMMALLDESRSISDIASDIRKEWGSKVNYAAKPYLDAMMSLDKITDDYGADGADQIVARFLGNARSFTGPRAKELKAELKALLKEDVEEDRDTDMQTAKALAHAGKHDEAAVMFKRLGISYVVVKRQDTPTPVESVYDAVLGEKKYIVYVDGEEKETIDAGSHNAAEKKAQKKYPGKQVEVTYTEESVNENADPVYLELTKHASDQRVYFMVTDDLKNGGYKGMQVVHWEGDKKPKKAVQKTMSKSDIPAYKQLKKDELPPEVLARFNEDVEAPEGVIAEMKALLGEAKAGFKVGDKVEVTKGKNKGLTGTVTIVASDVVSVDLGIYHYAVRPADLVKVENESADDDTDVAKTILAQMGGMGRIKAMLGAKFIEKIPNGVAIRWPSKERSKGNHVEITLRPDDTYNMEFFNVGGANKKSVKKYEGIYFDQLIEIFERQTGWSLRL